jgi:WD40 repeat protein
MLHQDRVLAVAFRRDGRTIVTAGEDTTARLWDGPTGRSLGLVVRHEGRVGVASFSPDGRTLLTAGWDGTARLWDPPEPVPGGVEQVVLAVQVLTGLEMAGDEVVRVLDTPAWQRRHRRLEELGGSPWR